MKHVSFQELNLNSILKKNENYMIYLKNNYNTHKHTDSI